VHIPEEYPHQKQKYQCLEHKAEYPREGMMAVRAEPVGCVDLVVPGVPAPEKAGVLDAMAQARKSVAEPHRKPSLDQKGASPLTLTRRFADPVRPDLEEAKEQQTEQRAECKRIPQPETQIKGAIIPLAGAAKRLVKMATHRQHQRHRKPDCSRPQERSLRVHKG